MLLSLDWWREEDSNLRPLGYEPNELPLLHPAICVAKVLLISTFTKYFSKKICFKAII